METEWGDHEAWEDVENIDEEWEWLDDGDVHGSHIDPDLIGEWTGTASMQNGFPIPLVVFTLDGEGRWNATDGGAGWYVADTSVTPHTLDLHMTGATNDTLLSVYRINPPAHAGMPRQLLLVMGAPGTPRPHSFENPPMSPDVEVWTDWSDAPRADARAVLQGEWHGVVGAPANGERFQLKVDGDHFHLTMTSAPHLINCAGRITTYSNTLYVDLELSSDTSGCAGLGRDTVPGLYALNAGGYLTLSLARPSYPRPSVVGGAAQYAWTLTEWTHGVDSQLLGDWWGGGIEHDYRPLRNGDAQEKLYTFQAGLLGQPNPVFASYGDMGEWSTEAPAEGPKQLTMHFIGDTTVRCVYEQNIHDGRRVLEVVQGEPRPSSVSLPPAPGNVAYLATQKEPMHDKSLHFVSGGTYTGRVEHVDGTTTSVTFHFDEETAAFRFHYDAVACAGTVSWTDSQQYPMWAFLVFAGSDSNACPWARNTSAIFTENIFPTSRVTDDLTLALARPREPRPVVLTPNAYAVRMHVVREASSGGGGGLSTGARVGIGLGVSAGACALVWAFVRHRRRRAAEQGHYTRQEHT